MANFNRLVNIIFIGSFFVVIAGAFVKYYITREYYFYIETSCDPTTEHCFTRSCDTEECPPNGFREYKQYKLRAYQFDQCQEDNCEQFCHVGRGCIEISCGENNDDTCSGTL